MNHEMKKFIYTMVESGKCVFQMDGDRILQGIRYPASNVGKYCYLNFDNGCVCQYVDVEIPLIGKRKRCILDAIRW